MPPAFKIKPVAGRRSIQTNDVRSGELVQGVKKMMRSAIVVSVSVPTGLAVSLLAERLRHAWPHPGSEGHEEAARHVPVVQRSRPVGFPSSVAEFLLVFRLRARSRSALAADMLERAVRVVFVTCQHWFCATETPEVTRRSSRRTG
jgi:hypothetical protein